MNPQELLETLRERDVWVWADGERLRFSAPAGVPEAEILDTLKPHKAAILGYLNSAAELSFAQQRFWILDQLSPGGTAYNTASAVELRGDLDVAAIEAAVEALVRRHQGLRTLFVEVDGQPRQRVDADARSTWAQTDLDGTSDNRQRLSELLRQQTGRRFDLAAGPVFRAHLYRLSADCHVLLLVMHHIVSDGWSVGILHHDLAALYSEHVAGKPAALPPLRLQYRDYARWQRRRLTGDALDAAVDHWRARLAGAPTVLELPADRIRPIVESHRGSFEPFQLPAALAERLQRLSRREGVTLFMTLLAGFATLLARYTGHDDLLIGTPVAGRQRAETEPVVGLFTNTLVLRADLQGAPTTTALLARMRDVCLDAFTRQELPFERLVEALHPARDLSRNPLFQVMFALENTPHAAPAFEGLEATTFGFDSGAAQFDLALYMREEPGGLSGSLNYATDLFDRTTIARMALHWQHLLEAMCSTPTIPVQALPILTDTELDQVVRTFNETATDYGADGQLHRLIEAQVERTPDAVALVVGGQTLTFAELNGRGNQLARVLRAHGVGPNVLVGICAERSAELVVALLAVLKAGGAYIPLDPSYPTDRLGHMLDDAHAPVVLIQPHLRDVLPATAARVIDLDPGGRAGADESTANLSHVGTPDNLAYVIFTSGSTGRPKGAMNAHRGIVNRLLWMQETYRLSPADRVLQKTPYSFDVSVWEFFWPLLTGTPLVMARPDGHKDPAYLVNLIRQAGITTLHFVPSMLRAFLDAAGVEACVSLTRIICSGEALPYELQERVFATFPCVELHNLYGPTECAVDVSAWPCRRDDRRRIVPIGRPVANTQLYVLDERLQPVPIGVAGELYIGGRQVGQGYVRRPELTAERFVPDPFAGTTTARLYKTGDRARWLPDGAVEYLGRLDFQVKIRGQRIELGEIEAVLDQHPSVGQSVVVAREDVPGDQRLVAYLVPRGDAPAAAALKAQLGATLPSYMVPSAFVIMPALPLTASGKVDRKALPAPDRAAGAAEFVAPRTPTEAILAGLWAEVLHRERVGVEDNFFALGGHSLLATQVVARVRQAFGIELPLRDLFEAPEVGTLASRVDSARSATAGAIAAPAITATAESGPAPLSFAQQRLWVLDRIAPGSASYTLPVALELKGRLDVAALERALAAIISRHEPLRMVFIELGGEPRQVVGETGTWSLPIVDASNETEPRRHTERMLRAATARPFDLSQGPVFRVCLHRESAETHVLSMVMHHIVSDGWSLGVLVGELSACYRAFASGIAASLLPLPVGYTDYARWQRRWLSGDTVERQLDYWRSQLSGAPLVLDLPTDRPRPPVESHRGAVHAFTLPRSLVDRLDLLSRHEGTTLFMTLLSGFALLLGRYTGQGDLLIGTPVANRARAELEGLIGFFVNTLVVRADLSGAPTARTVLARMREVCLDAFAHQDAPFEQVVEALRPVRDTSRNAVVQVMFAHQNAPAPLTDLPGLAVTTVAAEITTAQFDLSLLTWETPEGLGAAFSYATDLFDAATIARLASHWTALLEAITEAPDRSAADLLPLTDAERRQIDDWNSTATQFPTPLPVHRLVEEQARLGPDRLAVAGGGRRLSYRELDERAERLASRLRRLGVGQGQLVATYLERSPVMVAAQLAVLKTGAAYLPIDPASPVERVRRLLADSGAAAVLSQASLTRALPAPGPAVLDVEADGPAASAGDAAPQVAPVPPDQLAYVIYTSGSTGHPKGVAITHASLFNLICWHRRAFDVTAADRATQLAGPAFDASVWETWPYLAAGASVHFPDEATRLEPAALVRWIAAENITVTFLPTPLAEAALREPWPAGIGLRAMLTGGDRLTVRPEARLPFRLFNHYGPTENTVVSTWAEVEPASSSTTLPPIGRPLPNTTAHVVDATLRPVPIGVPGELLVGGAQVAAGYWQRADLTAEKFVEVTWNGVGQRLYRTGDLVRYRPDGQLEFLGRLDHQVKIRGFRIELGEIEAALSSHPAVREAVVVARDDGGGDRRLLAYVGAAPPTTVLEGELRAHLRAAVPDYMIPARIVVLDQLPLTANGKVDRRALPDPAPPAREHAGDGPSSGLEERIATVWREALGRDDVGPADNFFDLGGHSLLVVKIHARLRSELGLDLRVVDLFAHPTIRSLARFADDKAAGSATSARPLDSRRASNHDPASPLAIIGMAGRFPGAGDLTTFWNNLRDGRETVSFFTVDEMRAAGIPDDVLQASDYVAARGYLAAADVFDAGFFGYSAREAERLDPQHRLLLECAAETLDRAGYDPDRFAGAIGVYAGASSSFYGSGSLEDDASGGLQAILGTRPDFLTTRISYKLNLRGPSVNVQTACSTSLVAVHQACRALRSGECDMALAGGVSVTVPLKAGYTFVPDGIGSKDGHCRPFDRAASGTVAGNGVGLVLLKRLAEALADGDQIHAVIRGSAITNDGSTKVGYTAPSVEGQARTIALALADAGVEPDSIDYIETHGTGTALGDPIEVAALTEALGNGQDRSSPRWLGAAKSNIGHLDAAAGVTGLIKAALSLRHRELVPTVHFTEPNPQIDFAAGRFAVSAALQPWERRGDTPRRAGVSSFGIGGTNAHAILEEAPAVAAAAAPSGRWQLLCLSARTPEALAASRARLATHLESHPEVSLADTAYTLQIGRRQLQHRCVVVAGERLDAVRALESTDAAGAITGTAPAGRRTVVFMFTGQGAQYPGMASGLHQTQPVFRAAFDRCCDALPSAIAHQLRDTLTGTSGADAAARLSDTSLAQPALFVVEYALARLWISLGVVPAAMIGHSVGEFVAAALAGVMALEDALLVIVERARLMSTMPKGAMMALPMSASQVEPLLGEHLALAAVNGPSLSVVSGPEAEIVALEQRVSAQGLTGRRLHTSHAFHSGMMDPILGAFRERLRSVALHPPRIPYISNLTGTWITERQATDPSYYADHLRCPVRFSDGLDLLLKDPGHVFVEVGPSTTLATLAKRHPSRTDAHVVVASTRHPDDGRTDEACLLEGLGRLWIAGVTPAWTAWHTGGRRRVELPPYPFARTRYWLSDCRASAPRPSRSRRTNPAEWLHVPTWRRTAASVAEVAKSQGRWLVFVDDHGIGDAVARELSAHGATVTTVAPGSRYARHSATTYTIDPATRDDYARLVADLDGTSSAPELIGHFWSVDRDEDVAADPAFRARCEDRGFFSLVYLLQAFDATGRRESLGLAAITTHTQDVDGREVICPEKALALGPCKVAGMEFPNVLARSIDISMAGDLGHLAATLATDLCAAWTDPVVAYRGRHRWVQSFDQVQRSVTAGRPSSLRERGVYLVTGGLGRVGLELAEALAQTGPVSLALLTRTGLPPREDWRHWLAGHRDSDTTSQRIRRVGALEAAGATVLVVEADVSDEAQMLAALDSIDATLGPLNGVLHAAGAEREPVPLRALRRAEFDVQFRPKLLGVRVLERLMHERELDFCILQSSLASVLGVAGFASYAAAHLYMDAFAIRHNRAGTQPWRVVNWDYWQIDAATDDRTSRRLEFHMRPDEGREAFRRVLAVPDLSQVLISSGPLDQRVAQWLRRESEPADDPGITAAGPTARVSYSRPALSSAFAPPRNDIEQTLAAIWRDLFGIDDVGIHDNFFELGGDSVLNLQVSARASQAGLHLPPRLIFEKQTIAELATVVATPDGTGATVRDVPPESVLTPAVVASTVSEADLGEIWRQLNGEDEPER